MTTEYKIIEPGGMAGFISDLAKRRKVFAPVVAGSLTKFDWVRDGQAVALDSAIPRSGAKQALLPRTEVLFYFKLGKGTEQVAGPKPPEPQIIFGLHPTDIAAVRVLDAVFSAEPSPDGPYIDRRAATAIIGMGRGPEESPDTCFCEMLGISLMDPGEADMFITRLASGRFMLEVFDSERREKIADLMDCVESLPDASAEDIAELEALRGAAAKRVTDVLDPAALAEKLDGMFESDFWRQIGQRCVGCGACAYLCPTCHCFDISEETRGQLGARVRNWDTCQFSQFTKHASGHNPRDNQNPRARQRIMHKFNYGYKNFGITFCTGCGRCIEACPAHGDVREVLKAIEERK